MNKYFALRKTNRMRTELLTEKSQEQIKEVIRYLRRVSWDFCGIELVRSERPDVVLMDIRMPEVDGVECTRLIKSAYPNIKVIVLTTFDDDEYVFNALRFGASG